MDPLRQGLNILFTCSDGKEHPIKIDGKRVFLASDGDSTPLWITIPNAQEAGAFILECVAGTFIEMNAAGVRATTAATPLVLEPISEKDGMFRLRTKDGLYLAAREPGEPLVVTADRNDRTAFRSTIALGAREPGRWTPSRKFAAQPGAKRDVTQSTHLWIFQCAVDLILKPGSILGTGHNIDALRDLLGDTRFLGAIMDGIDAADNTDMFDKDTSGFVYSAHFYDPGTGKGGYWDPNPSGEINALKYGSRYFRDSLSEADSYAAGRKLGLAIHYLQDLCQPMHAGQFPNYHLVLQNLWLKVGIGVPIAVPLMAIPIVREIFISSLAAAILANPDFRHENYELWILGMQANHALTMAEVGDADRLRYSQTVEEWWKTAADYGSAEFCAWRSMTDSPASNTVTFKRLSPEEAAKLQYDSWVPTTRNSLKVSQRLTLGLLLNWAYTPSKLVSSRSLASALSNRGLQLLPLDVKGNRKQGIFYYIPGGRQAGLGISSGDGVFEAKFLCFQGTPVANSGFESDLYSPEDRYLTLDVNGDGKSDLFYWGRGFAGLYISKGDGTFQHHRLCIAGTPVRGTGFVGDVSSPEDRFVAVDVDGDGKSELFYYGRGYAGLYMSWINSRFEHVPLCVGGKLVPETGFFGDLSSPEDRFLALDVTGNGRGASLFYYGRKFAGLYIPAGYGRFVHVPLCVSGQPVPLTGFKCDLSSPEDNFLALDVDGDGKSDLFYYGRKYAGLYMSRGDGTFIHCSLCEAGKPVSGTGFVGDVSSPEDRFVAVDVDGDGKSELFYYGRGYAGLYVRRDVCAFEHIPLCVGNRPARERGFVNDLSSPEDRFLALDVNGDGKYGLFYYGRGYAGVYIPTGFGKFKHRAISPATS